RTEYARQIPAALALRAAVGRGEGRLAGDMSVDVEADECRGCVRWDIELVRVERIHGEDIPVRLSRRRARPAISGRAEISIALHGADWEAAALRIARARVQLRRAGRKVVHDPVPP